MTTFQSACKAWWQKLSEYAVLGRPIFDKAVRHSYVILFTSHTIMHEPSANQNRLDSEKCDTQHFKERNPTRWKNSLYDRKKTVIYHTRMTPIGSGYLLNKTDIYLIMKRNKHLYMHVFNLDMTSKYCWYSITKHCTYDCMLPL